ncbi:MAG: hypothetical protein J6B49_05405 [Phascolarctobacterium sp.]|nr:hypothetical protein [Phascolarctobacterium sp.]
MSGVCDGIKFHGVNDLSSVYYLEKIESVLDEFNEHKQYTDVNEIIELFNIKQYIENDMYLKSWDEEKIDEYKKKTTKFLTIIGKYFSTINNSNFLNVYSLVWKLYRDDFWLLLNKFKCFKRIEVNKILSLLNDEPYNLRHILSYKDCIVSYSDEILSFMREYVRSAEYLMDYFLSDGNVKYYFPQGITSGLHEEIMWKYIVLEEANPNYLELIYKSQSTKEFPLKDELRLAAKKKYESICEKHFKNNPDRFTEVKILFEDLGNEIKKTSCKDNYVNVSYNLKWIDKYVDYATILNNFIYIFDFVDKDCRCNFVAHNYEMGELEKRIGVRGKKEYRIGIAFNVSQMIYNGTLEVYYKYLLDKGVGLEDVFKWFFETYLKEEFNVEGFIFNTVTKDASFYEKIKHLTSEMEGVLKQFEQFVSKGYIDRDLLEISSSSIIYKDISSMIDTKYFYSDSEVLMSEIQYWFSDQSMLGYTEKTKEEYRTLYDLLNNEHIKIEEFYDFQRKILEWLIERGSLIQYKDGTIKINYNRVYFLRQLYLKEVVCLNYYDNWNKLIGELSSAREIVSESKLFTKFEVNYINYMLNKAEFNNGNDLRNKYNHGSYPQEPHIQKRDYLELLKIMILIVIKINEEFCLKFPQKECNVDII